MLSNKIRYGASDLDEENLSNDFTFIYIDSVSTIYMLVQTSMIFFINLLNHENLFFAKP